jgi:nucleotide-binding universal stress UspA family protein
MSRYPPRPAPHRQTRSGIPGGKICAIPGKDRRIAPAARWYTGGMKTFLVPVDFSAVTDKVIDAALTFARALPGRVVLLHIIQPPVIAGGEYALPAEAVEEVVNNNRRSALQKLDGRLETFRSAGIECSVATEVGAPDRAILDTAAKCHADYVIMGSHGHGKLYDFLVGSTASGVIKKAKCSVIVIPPVDRPG